MQLSDVGDLIGMESTSCGYLDPETDIALSSKPKPKPKPEGLKKRRSLKTIAKKELPPPLPIQTSTVMKRYCTDDGRLIIVEETIESPKYHFTAHRSDGRLTLQLDVPYNESRCNARNVSVEEDEVTTTAVAGGGGGLRYNAAVRVAEKTTMGVCKFDEQSQVHAIMPVQI